MLLIWVPVLCLALQTGAARRWDPYEDPVSEEGEVSDEESYYDSSEEGTYEDGSSSSSSSSEEEPDQDIAKWRRVLKLNIDKKKTTSTTTRTAPKPNLYPGPTNRMTGRRFEVPTPVPPLPPDVESVDEIRARLNGKTLEDANMTHNSSSFKMSFAFSAESSSRSSATEDLQNVICLMDCRIASTSHMSGFRGKDAQKIHEDELEQQWNNMTEVERQLIAAIAANETVPAENTARRAMVSVGSGRFSSVFQVFSDWCSQNCDAVKIRAEKKGRGHHRHHHSSKSSRNTEEPEETTTSTTTTTTTTTTSTTTAAPDLLSDYESDEDLASKKGQKSERRSEVAPSPDYEPDVRRDGSGTKPADSVPLTVQVPVPHVLNHLFGENTVSALASPRLCMCGFQSAKICYCQPSKKGEPLLTMTPNF